MDPEVGQSGLMFESCHQNEIKSRNQRRAGDRTWVLFGVDHLQSFSIAPLFCMKTSPWPEVGKRQSCRREGLPNPEAARIVT